MLIKNNHTATIHLPDVKIDAGYPGPSSYSLHPGINEVSDAYMDRLGDHPFVVDLFKKKKERGALLETWKPTEADEVQPAKPMGMTAPKGDASTIEPLPRATDPAPSLPSLPPPPVKS